MSFLGPMLGLFGAGVGAATGSAMVGGTTAILSGAAMGAGVGLGIAGAIQQHKEYRESKRVREAALEEVRKDGEKKRGALDAAARKVYNRSRSRSLFRPSGAFAVQLDGDGDGDDGIPVFGV
jgi:hypothetical protein